MENYKLLDNYKNESPNKKHKPRISSPSHEAIKQVIAAIRSLPFIAKVGYTEYYEKDSIKAHYLTFDRDTYFRGWGTIERNLIPNADSR